ncbi:MAG: TerB family tellurite resistance protein [Gemmobacter sp.]
MSIWTRISEALAALGRGEGLVALFDRLRGVRPATPERSVAFTIAVLALGAKMAKADGQVTKDEVAAFRRIFVIEPEEEANAAQVFNLARQDVAGFDAYARKIRAMFGDKDDETLKDVLEGLFSVAMADGAYHAQEDAYLAEVARIFGLEPACYQAIRARYVEGAPRDPYDVLGVSAFAPIDQVRSAWKAAVLDTHPDRLMARGVPPEAVKLAERRLAAINAAWDEINAKRAA